MGIVMGIGKGTGMGMEAGMGMGTSMGMGTGIRLPASSDQILSAMQRAWERLTVAWLDVTLIALEPLDLPAYKGSTLRGAFGWAFQKVSCITGYRRCSDCKNRSICAYAQVFEATRPSGSHPPLEGLQDVTRPFVLRPPLERKQVYQPGEQLRVELLLFGLAIPLTPLFVRAFMDMAAQGLGRGRRRAKLDRVEARLPGQERIILFPSDGGEGVGEARGSGDGVRAVDGTRTFYTTLAEWLAGGDDAAAGPVRVDFITMTRLKNDGRLVGSGPAFPILVAALLRRISTLMWYLAEQGSAWPLPTPSERGYAARDEEEADGDRAWPYRQLVKQAEEVELIQADTRWTDWERFSHRQQQHMSLGGLVGTAVYSEAARAFQPLLRVGEIMHVGKGSTFGLGQFRVGGMEG